MAGVLGRKGRHLKWMLSEQLEQGLIKVSLPMIKAKLSLLQVPVKSLLRDPVEFSQASLGVTPERFNSVDMVTSPGKFVLAMMDSEMLVKTQVDQSILSSPAIGVNEAF